MSMTVAARRPVAAESLKIGLLYLALTAVFFAGISLFLPRDAGQAPATGFVGQSGIVDTFAGFASFAIMSLAVWRFRSLGMVRNVLLCFAAASVTAVGEFYLTMQVYKAFHDAGSFDFGLAANVDELFMCWAVYFGWSCLFLAILYSFDIRDRERRLAAAREEALASQMSALRYQVGPHFLFNTLNSIVWLIEQGSSDRAQRMVLSLSTFLRTTLTLDPFDDIPLSQEIALQEEYIEIERERFSDRMIFTIAVPEAVGVGLVPSLILQPLIENAIKHGVGAKAGLVNIMLFAERSDDRLRISIENDIPVVDPPTQAAGMGVGLSNVAARLQARFQGRASFVASSVGPGVYKAVLDIPWKAE